MIEVFSLGDWVLAHIWLKYVWEFNLLGWVFDLVGIFSWLRPLDWFFSVLRVYCYLGVYLSAVTIWFMPFVISFILLMPRYAQEKKKSYPMLQNQFYSAFKFAFLYIPSSQLISSQHPTPYTDLLSVCVRLEWNSHKMGVSFSTSMMNLIKCKKIKTCSN